MSTIFGMKEGGSALSEEEDHFCVFLSSWRPPVELPFMGSLPYSLVFTLRLAPLREGVMTSLAASSVFSFIDLASSEEATSDKERTRRFINTSLLSLGSIIATLAENASAGKNDHVIFRSSSSKFTRMLQPSLSGDAHISVICTLNPDASAVAESTSTLLFVQRTKKVQLNAKKKEVVDTDALLARYRQEIEGRDAHRTVVRVRPYNCTGV
ncbi:Kinesin motor domain containing protein [Russula decolorans]